VKRSPLLTELREAILTAAILRRQAEAVEWAQKQKAQTETRPRRKNKTEKANA
jgi:hypothetical protein